MTDQRAISTERGVPTAAVAGAFALIIFTLLTAAYARLTDMGTSRMPAAQVVAVRSLLFEDASDGGVVVRDAQTKGVIRVLEPGSNGFIRATMRGFVRERRMGNLGADVPFLLIRRTDGSLSLEDRATGRKADLDAFGPANSGAFATLFEEADRS